MLEIWKRVLEANVTRGNPKIDGGSTAHSLGVNLLHSSLRFWIQEDLHVSVTDGAYCT